MIILTNDDAVLQIVENISKIIITVTSYRVRWRLKSQAIRLFAQPFDQAQIKENIKTPCHSILWGESTGDWLIPLT